MTYYLYQQPENIDQIINPSDFCYSLDDLGELQQWHIETSADLRAFILQCDEYPQEDKYYPPEQIWQYHPLCLWYQDNLT